MNEIPPCSCLIYDLLRCEGTGVGASTECKQMTDPGPCQLEAERHLVQVLRGDSHLPPSGGLGIARGAQEVALGMLLWWAPALGSLGLLANGVGLPLSALTPSLGSRIM